MSFCLASVIWAGNLTQSAHTFSNPEYILSHIDLLPVVMAHLCICVAASFRILLSLCTVVYDLWLMQTLCHIDTNKTFLIVSASCFVWAYLISACDNRSIRNLFFLDLQEYASDKHQYVVTSQYLDSYRLAAIHNAQCNNLKTKLLALSKDCLWREVLDHFSSFFEQVI